MFSANKYAIILNKLGVKNMNTQKLIYIADDDDNIRNAIKTFLQNENYRVADFENGDLLLTAFAKSPCDLVILDIMMPGLNGLEICTKIRKISTVPIIMLTALDSDLDYANALNLGSDDYFTKPFSAMSLVMRVKSIFRRIEFEQNKNASINESPIISFGNISMDIGNKETYINGDMLSLTPNEFDLLHYLIKNSNRAVSRDELLKNIWGYSTEVETRATDDTVRRLRKKITTSSVLIEAIWGFGFKLKVCDKKC